jgi:hypothetical protein
MKLERVFWILALTAFVAYASHPQDEQPKPLKSDPEAAPGQPSEESAKEALLLRSLADLLLEKDERVRRLAQQDLLKWGPKAIPVLEDRLRQKGSLPYYEMIRLIEAKHVPEVPNAPRADDPELQRFADLAPRIKPPPREVIDQYLLLKLYEAYARIARKDFEGAESVLRAIRTFDTGWKYSDWVVDLHNYAQMKVLEGRFLKPSAEPAKAIVVVGEPVDVVLKLQNISAQKIVITAGDLAAPILRSKVLSKAIDFNGAEQEDQDERLYFEFPKRVEIEPGQTWQSTVRFETKDFLPKAEVYREHTYHLFTTHLNIESGEGKLNRRLVFPTARVKAVPEAFKELGGDPMQSWTLMINGQNDQLGTVKGLFICAHLLRDNPDWVDKALKQLVPLLEKATNSAGIDAAIRLLEVLTGQRQESREEWLKWWDRYLKLRRGSK